MANIRIWPPLLISQANGVVSPVTSMLVYLAPFFTKACWTLAESRYAPTTSPASLIPMAWVPVDLGKLMAVNLPPEYTNPSNKPVLVLVQKPAAAFDLLIP